MYARSSGSYGPIAALGLEPYGLGFGLVNIRSSTRATTGAGTLFWYRLVTKSACSSVKTGCLPDSELGVTPPASHGAPCDEKCAFSVARVLGVDGEIGIVGSCRRGLGRTPAGVELTSGTLPWTALPPWGLRDVAADAGSEVGWSPVSGAAVVSTPLMLALLSSPVKIDPSPAALAKGSTRVPARNLDSGRRRRGVVLPMDARDLRRRKKRIANAPSTSRPTAPAAAPPAMAPTLVFEPKVVRLLPPDEELDVAPTPADVDVLLVSEDAIAGGVAVEEEVWFDVAGVLCDDCEAVVAEGMEEPCVVVVGVWFTAELVDVVPATTASLTSI